MAAATRVLFLAAAGMLTMVQGAMANPCASFPLNIALVKQQAQGGNAYCQAVLALEYSRGTGGTRSDAKFYALAAGLLDSNDPMAIYVVAALFRDGSSLHGIAQDEARSVQLNTEFVATVNVETSRDPNQLLALGFVRRFGRDDQQADGPLGCTYIRRAADLGHPHGMFHVASCIEAKHIEGATQQDRLSWLTKAAELGHPNAAWSLGENSFEAEFLKEAQGYFEVAVTFGDPDFGLRLGRMYEAGLFGAPNWNKASEFYQQASKDGNENASYRLGWIYLTGHGDFEESFELAIDAFQTAKDQGNLEAARILEVLSE